MIDVSDKDHCSGIYNPRNNSIEWTFTTQDVDSGMHGNMQLLMDMNTGDFYPIDGRFKNCYMIGYEDSEAHLIHGDDWGVLQKDYETVYDGNIDIDETNANKVSIRALTAYSASVACPNYSYANGYRVTFAGTTLGAYPIGVGMRVYAVSYDGTNYTIDKDDWRVVIDVATNYLYLSLLRDWANANYTHSDGNPYDYPEYVLLGGVYAWCDTPALEDAVVTNATLRLVPTSGATGYVNLTGYKHLDESTVPDKTDRYEVPTITNTAKEKLPFRTSIGTGSTVQARIFSIGCGYKFACKELSIDYTSTTGDM